MKPSDLPIVGPISNTDKDIFGSFTRLRGKKILCLGFSEPEIGELVAPYDPSKITLLTKWADHGDALVKNYDLIIGDITQKTGLPENSFDAILTLSVLEHLSDLNAAFDEMTKLVKPGGCQVHFFGPVWSSAYGHHLYANAKDPLLNFCSWTMPAHMHLLCTPAEITEYYQCKNYEPSAVSAVLHWFYETKIINREPFDSYLKIFNQQRFQITRLEVMSNHLPEMHEHNLISRHPTISDFSAYGAKVCLIKK